MRSLLSAFLLSVAAVSQTPAASQAVTTLHSAVTAQFGSNTINDVQLTGTVTTHFGKNDQGTVTLQADIAGHSKVTLNLAAGSRTEYSSGHSEAPACTWAGTDSQVHPVSDIRIRVRASVRQRYAPAMATPTPTRSSVHHRTSLA